MRRGHTLVEAGVVLAIILTLAGMLFPVVSVIRSAATTPAAAVDPPTTWTMHTVQHDGHWWVIRGEHFVHHPDCPCVTKRPESD